MEKDGFSCSWCVQGWEVERELNKLELVTVLEGVLQSRMATQLWIFDLVKLWSRESLS